MENVHAKPRDRGNESNLARMRLAAGLTQQQLADRIGVTLVTVARWEGGTRSPSGKMLIRIAGALDCRAEDLI